MAHCTKKERKVKVKRSLDLSIWSVLSVRHRSVDFCVTQKRWIKMSNWGSTNYTKTCKPFVLNHMNQLNSSSLRAIHLEKEKNHFSVKPLVGDYPISFTGWAAASGGSGRCEALTASPWRQMTSVMTAGGQSCGKACCWSARPGRRDAVGSGWKSEINISDLWKRSFYLLFLQCVCWTLTTALLVSLPH